MRADSFRASIVGCVHMIGLLQGPRRARLDWRHLAYGIRWRWSGQYFPAHHYRRIIEGWRSGGGALVCGSSDWTGHSALRYVELQHEFLPRIARGEMTFCVCMSETEAGSDLAAVRTKARLERGTWLINGHKIWTTYAHVSDFAYVLARTDDTGAKHVGFD